MTFKHCDLVIDTITGRTMLVLDEDNNEVLCSFVVANKYKVDTFRSSQLKSIVSYMFEFLDKQETLKNEAQSKAKLEQIRERLALQKEKRQAK